MWCLGLKVNYISYFNHFVDAGHLHYDCTPGSGTKYLEIDRDICCLACTVRYCPVQCGTKRDIEPCGLPGKKKTALGEIHLRYIYIYITVLYSAVRKGSCVSSSH